MDIDAALIGVGIHGRLTQAECAKKYGLGRGQLSRHVQNGHIAAVMAAVSDKVTALHGEGMLTELAGLYERAQRMLAKAEHADDTKVAIQAIREARGCIETFAKIGLAMAQGQQADPEDTRGDLDSKIDEALRRRERRLAVEQENPTSGADEDVVEAEIVDESGTI